MAANSEKSVAAKIPKDLHDKLVAAAKKGRRSVAMQVEIFIERGVRNLKLEAKP